MQAKNPIRSSKSFIWYTKDVLGTGATSTVFLGRFKGRGNVVLFPESATDMEPEIVIYAEREYSSMKNGDKVAVKVFNNLSFMRPSSVQQREFEVLLKLKHQNVVKLIAIEEDQLQKQPVLVMELCTGGSLYSMLEDPENSYGLSEKEFLKVLGNISAGMKHLREMDIVHRDIKPGNIMRVKDVDGGYIYKLADFGAARELEEDQPYMSLYGTEEYLHPDLYQRAVLRQHTNQAFTARTDLWSTGVTLYHTATGVLPFRPFGGRKNRDVMFHITTKKRSGIISAVQKDSQGGEIEWSEKLPNHCHISPGLRRYVTTMLAGLMECHMARMWTFDKFFSHVRMILDMVVIYVFVPRTSDILKVYVPHDGKYQAFQEQVSSLTNIPDKEQLFFFEFEEFVPLMTLTCSDFPKTSQDKPIILFERNFTELRHLVPPSMPSTRKAATHFSLENDLALAKMYAAVLYYQRSVLEETILKQKSYFLVPKTIQTVLKAKVLRLQRDAKVVENVISQIDTTTTLWRNMSPYIKPMIESAAPEMNVTLVQRIVKCQRDLESLHVEYGELSQDFQQSQQVLREILEPNVIMRSNLLALWKSKMKDFKPCEVCVGKFEVYLQDSVQIYQQFRKDRQAKKLSYNEEQIHKMDKDKLGMKCAEATSLFSGHCESKWKKIFIQFKDWWTNHAVVYQTQADHTERGLHALSSTAHRLKTSIQELVAKIQIDVLEYERHVRKNLQEKLSQQPEIMDASDATTSVSGLVLTQEIGTGSIVTQETQGPEAKSSHTSVSTSMDLPSQSDSIMHSIETTREEMKRLQESGQGWMRVTKKQKKMLELLGQSARDGIAFMENAKLSTG